MAKGDMVKAYVRSGGQYAIQTGMQVVVQGRSLGYEWEKDGNLQWFVIREKTRGGTTTREVRVAAAELMYFEAELKEM